MEASLSQAMRRAVHLHERGQLDQAETLYRGALAAKPRDFEAARRLGLLKLQQGCPFEALPFLTAATRCRPADAAALSNLGVALAAAGRVEEALAAYDRALALAPNLADTHNNRGIALHRLGRAGEALASYDRAIAIRPDYPAALNNRGNALRGLGRVAEALQSFERAIARKPDYAEAHNNRGAALTELGRLEEALASYDKAIACKPAYAEAHNNRGNALRDLGRPVEALESYDRAIARKRDYAEAHNNRGSALHDLGRLAEALASYDQAIAVMPGCAEAFANRGVVLREAKRFEEAVASYDRAIALRPHYVEALSNRANGLLELNRPEQALASSDRAIALKADCAEAHSARGNALRMLGRAREALESYDRAIAIDPEGAVPYDNKAIVLAELGRSSEATRAFAAAIERAPRRVRTYYNLAAFTVGAMDEAHLAAMEDMARDMGSLKEDERIELNFALGKALGDANQYDRSFPHLLEANAAKRKATPYDEARELDAFVRTRAIFTPEMMRARAGFGDPSQAPIFILGMPRSGTSLVEQILASHPSVFGGGENDFFAAALKRFVRADGRALQFPDDVAEFSGASLRQLGAAYLERLKALSPGADRFADKTIDNFRFVGLIHLALPNARILHIRRDAVDACLSCFSRNFVGNHPYANDLAELGRYWNARDALMAHWRATLPAGVMIDVQYEDVVADLDGQARRIVAHCGLEWDDRCLSFHATERQVRTASASQVRQPIYRSSVERWRRYERFLGPLLAELRPERG